MINLYIVNGSDYPRHIGDLLLEHPTYTDGDPLPDGWEVVNKTEMPPSDGVVYYVEGFPEQTKEGWRQTWVTLNVADIERTPREGRPR